MKAFKTKATPHPLERYPEHVQAIGMIALETVSLETELASLFSRMLRMPRKSASAIFFSPNGDRVLGYFGKYSSCCLFPQSSRE